MGSPRCVRVTLADTHDWPTRTRGYVLEHCPAFVITPGPGLEHRCRWAVTHRATGRCVPVSDAEGWRNAFSLVQAAVVARAWTWAHDWSGGFLPSVETRDAVDTVIHVTFRQMGVSDG